MLIAGANNDTFEDDIKCLVVLEHHRQCAVEASSRCNHRALCAGRS